jgi:hypothetical protein
MRKNTHKAAETTRSRLSAMAIVWINFSSSEKIYFSLRQYCAPFQALMNGPLLLAFTVRLTLPEFSGGTSRESTKRQRR